MNTLPRADKPAEILEWTTEQLDKLDEAEDTTAAWAEREPYKGGVSRLLSMTREERENIKNVLKALDPGHRLKVREYGRLTELLRPPKGERGKYPRRPNVLDFAVDDSWRIIAVWKQHKLSPALGKITPEEIAVERLCRMCGMDASDEQKHELAEKVWQRRTHPSGTTGAQRRRRTNSRAK